MKLKDFMMLFGVKHNINDDDIEVDPTELVEKYFFDQDRQMPYGVDYRDQALDYYIKAELDFHTTCNTQSTYLKKFVRVQCPACGKQMHVGNSGGTQDTETYAYHCDCGVQIRLTMVQGAVDVIFPKTVILKPVESLKTKTKRGQHRMLVHGTEDNK